MNPKILYVAIGVLNTAPLRAMVRAAPGDGQRYDVLLETHWESRNGGHDGRTALLHLKDVTFAV